LLDNDLDFRASRTRDEPRHAITWKKGNIDAVNAADNIALLDAGNVSWAASDDVSNDDGIGWTRLQCDPDASVLGSRRWHRSGCRGGGGSRGWHISVHDAGDETRSSAQKPHVIRPILRQLRLHAGNERRIRRT